MGEFVRNKHNKHMIKNIMWLFLVLICFEVVSAATITGSVYDLALQSESNVIIEINTVPKQLLVSKSGEYAFNVKPGTYDLYAHTNTSKATESITVTDNDTYILDLILEESLVELPQDILTESDINVSLADFSEPTKKLWITVLVGLIIILALLAIGFYLFMRAKVAKSLKSVKHEVTHKEVTHKEDSSDKPLDEYEHKVLSIIKKEKRTTQKDLRKEIPLSEAKISLIITDLESKGKIRKIKKGRGNILIFIKD